jgi:hypothetical protein
MQEASEMWDNIGGKIKSLAKVLFWIGVIRAFAAFLLGLAAGSEYHVLGAVSGDIGAMMSLGVGMLLAETAGGEAIGLLISFIGLGVSILLSWVAAWFIYGYGELIETNVKISNSATASSPQILQLDSDVSPTESPRESAAKKAQFQITASAIITAMSILGVMFALFLPWVHGDSGIAVRVGFISAVLFGTAAVLGCGRKASKKKLYICAAAGILAAGAALGYYLHLGRGAEAGIFLTIAAGIAVSLAALIVSVLMDTKKGES